MQAPFPWYGGKRRWAEEIWARFGVPDVYVEPFAGSLAVLLANPRPAQREIVCDKDGLICNFWRALAHDPDAVAHYADYPTIHHDLTARHSWLVRWREGAAARLEEDPDFYDAKVAGWWVWGVSSWIGHGWCAKETYNRIPHVDPKAGCGQGVSAQRRTIPNRIPFIDHRLGGQGISAQRQTIPNKMPHFDSHLGGKGVAAQRTNIPNQIPFPRGQGVTAQRRTIPCGRLTDWFQALADRLKGAVVLNRDWTSAVTPTLLANTETSSDSFNRCILLDPPYVIGKREGNMYFGDHGDSVNQVAEASYQWAVEHGHEFRIAYCCHAGDFPTPPGWDMLERRFAKRINHAKTTDCVMFSPACVREEQGVLF